MLKQMDKATAEKIAKDMIVALQAVAAKYGVTVESPGGRYSTSDFTKKVIFKTISEEGFSVSAKRNFEVYGPMYDLKPELFGKQFVGRDGKLLEIVGFPTRKHKNPVELKDVKTGKKYCAPVDYVKHYFKD